MNRLTIIMYHYVRKIKNSKYPKIKGLELDAFKRQLDFLCNNFIIINVQTLLDFASDGKNLPENSCLLTFDDGYKDHINYVLPELLKRRIQGSFFPSAKPVVERSILDVNRIQFILACCENYKELVNAVNQLCLTSGINENEIINFWNKYGQSTRFSSREEIYIKHMLQHLLPEEIRSKISKILFEKYVGIDAEKFSEELYMSLDDVKKLVGSGMYVGGHGYKHLWMNKETRTSQENEINLSLEFLKNAEAPVKNWIMCYPYGAYNSETLAVLKEKNCSLGFTTAVGLNHLNSKNLFKLSRFDTKDFPQ